MTTITTTCAGCGRALAIPERYQGRDLKCPGCGHSFRVEPPAPPAPEPAPASVPTPVPAPTVAPPNVARPEAEGPFGDLFTASADGSAAPTREADTAALGTAPVYWRLTRLGALSTGLVSAVIHALLGLLVGVAVFFASLFLPAPAIPLVGGRLAGGLAIVALPALYGVAGFLAGALVALVYNLTARLVGGVKVLLE
jgi:hypothetical protein